MVRDNVMQLAGDAGALLDGSLSAEPNILGGFAVSAVLPLVEAAP